MVITDEQLAEWKRLADAFIVHECDCSACNLILNIPALCEEVVRLRALVAQGCDAAALAINEKHGTTPLTVCGPDRTDAGGGGIR